MSNIAPGRCRRTRTLPVPARPPIGASLSGETTDGAPKFVELRSGIDPRFGSEFVPILLRDARGANLLLMRILIVEDDAALAETLEELLIQAGFEAGRVSTGGAALERCDQAGDVDLVLLDLNLPDLDGHTVCRELRAHSAIAVIMLTARDAELDRVLGLEEGADDYVVKPFSNRELLARIRAVERRMRTTAAGGDADTSAVTDVIGGLRIDRRTRRVQLRGAEVQLTAKEFDVLAFLAEDPGGVRERHEIMEHVWDTHWYGPTKTLDAHVAAIRRKLGDAAWIEAVRGVGFRLGTRE
jgi:DNA-binding response OmpR family regulator